jgi:hypothetical protein
VQARGGDVADGAGLGRADAEREAAGEHDGLAVPAVAVGFAGVPGVDLFAFYAGHRLGAAVGGEHLAVEDHVRGTLGHRPFQDLRQARGLSGQHVDGLGDVPVDGRAGHAVVAAEGVDPGPVAEPAQRENRLVTAGELPAPGRGGAAAALGGQQPRQVAKQFRGYPFSGTSGLSVSLPGTHLSRG